MLSENVGSEIDVDGDLIFLSYVTIAERHVTTQIPHGLVFEIMHAVFGYPLEQ